MLAKIRTTHPRRLEGLSKRDDLPDPFTSPVMVVSAPAGFGKSQLLALWCEELRSERRVAYAVCSRLGETAATILELLYAGLQLSERYRSEASWQEQADTLLEALFESGPVTVILDDIHYLEADTSEVEECSLLLSYLLDYRPPDCHWIFSGRSRPRLADLDLKFVSGEVVLLGTSDLSLTAVQLEELSPGHGEKLAALTSGWPMACGVLLKSPPEKWEEQRDRLSQGLLDLALRELCPETRQAVAILGLMGSATKSELEQRGLWVRLEPLLESSTVILAQDEKLVVHPLFADQYRETATPEQREVAVELLMGSGRALEALELVQEPSRLSDLLETHGSKLLQAGRYRLLEKLLSRAEPRPALKILLGRLHWFRGEPSLALEAFHESAEAAEKVGDSATVSQAWKAAGRLYIEAVCPREAGVYLKRAYRALGPVDRVGKSELLNLLAENAVNEGQARLALRFRALARSWNRHQSEDLSITARLLLRSGRLSEAQGAVQVAVAENQSLEQSPLDGHRDPRLVLSYLSALQGRAEAAESTARAVLEEAIGQEDRRTQSVALTRIAHAHLLREPEVEGQSSIELYAEADSLAKTLGVERLRAEALMGMALYYTFHHNIPRAYEACREGVSIAQKSGDVWLTAWLRFVQAVAACEGGHPSGLELLDEAQSDFKSCRDRYGYALCDVWTHVITGDAGRSLAKHLSEFPFLTQRPSLFAPDPSRLNISSSTGEGSGGDAPQKLQVFCLGPLSLTRDGEPVPNKAFKRKKARELFVLLLASPDTFFHREELAEQLWPQASQQAALRDFRVALHALSDALEPQRPKNTLAFCIDRQEERYRLLSDKLDLDSGRFETLSLTNPGSPSDWERAVKLYRGSFCEDYPYIESLETIRRRYDEIYLQVAGKLAEHYLESDQATSATELAQKMIQRDPTWEPAYRTLMRSQHALGHEHLLPRTFTKCLETLEAELGVEPSEETFELARELLGDQLATLL